MPAGPRSEESLHALAAMDAATLSHQALTDAIVQTVAYSDVFDYPLTEAEIHRYLVGSPATADEVRSALRSGRLVPDHLGCTDGYYYLPGRAATVEKRRARARVSVDLWPKAIHYGQVIAHMPFVRMVAITGALSMDSSDPGDDLDYLIVTEPGRLWLCRAFVIGLVRAAERRGDIICPNYFISTRALVMAERNLYTAHEMTQMAPVAGLEIYDELRRVNPWVESFLPNACGAPRTLPITEAAPTWAWGLVEAALRTPPGAWLEQWEMERKVRKLKAQMAASNPIEADFGADWCKGHFGGYGRRTLGAMADRIGPTES
jgi:hypothetical protein